MKYKVYDHRFENGEHVFTNIEEFKDYQHKSVWACDNHLIVMDVQAEQITFIRDDTEKLWGDW